MLYMPLLEKPLIVRVSHCDAEILKGNVKPLFANGNKIYARLWSRDEKKQVLLHRLIMEGMLGRRLRPKEVVDHVDGNGLNNCRENLRLCTQGQNLANRAALNRNNTSGYRGVSYFRHCNKFAAQIRVDGKLRRLGLFPTAEEAYTRYREAALQQWGEFASV